MSLANFVKSADWKAEKHVPVITVEGAFVTLDKPGTLHAVAYCNLHGLWESDAKEA